MTPAQNSFYIAGGTVPGDAASYVTRQADDALFEGLMQGTFCYVLTARQMGKSSLMVRTVARLREVKERRIKTVVLDLSAIGRNLTLEQWYAGLRDRVGQQLDLEEEMEDFWNAHRSLSPMQRWLEAIRVVILEPSDDHLVIFVDEIDFVRSLPFDTDELFAAIRSCSNRRASDPVYARLTFCLLGVASPIELIQDDRVTPFNLGLRIELHDFTANEAGVLAWGLHSDSTLASRLLSRVLDWTGGHPYLTQKLCQSLAGKNAATFADVDKACAELFLLPEARTGDSNIAFVSNRFLHSGQDLSALLDLYRDVWKGRHIPNNETGQLISALKMCGIVRVEQGRLRVRNRIYALVFNREWIREHTPDAERRRQRSAYLRGVARAGLVGACALMIVGSLAFYAMRQTRIANTQTRLAKEQTRLADDARTKLQATLTTIYESDMNTAQREWTQGNIRRVAQIVNRYRADWNEQNPPPFLWRYLWGLIHQDKATLREHTRSITSVAFAPNGKMLVSASSDQTVIVRDASTHRILWQSVSLPSEVTGVAFSHHSKWVAACGGNRNNGWIRIWNAADGRPLRALPAQNGLVSVLAFSPDDRLLATGIASGGEDNPGQVTVWNTATGDKQNEWTESLSAGHCLAFSPDGKSLAVGTALRQHNAIKVRDAATGKLLRSFRTPRDKPVLCIAFSPDGKTLAADDGTNLALWQTKVKRAAQIFRGHTGQVREIVFAPNSKTLASAGDDTARLWDTVHGQLIRVLRGHEDQVQTVAFSPDGSTLASGSKDSTVRLWNATNVDRSLLTHSPDEAYNVAFAPDGLRMALTLNDNSIRIWDVTLWRQTYVLKVRGKAVYAIAFLPIRRELAINMDGKSIKLWNPETGHLRSVMPLTPAKSRFYAISPNEQIFAIGDPEHNNVSLWNLTNRSALRSPIVFENSPIAAAFSPDSRTLAIARDAPDNRIVLIDTATWQEQQTLALRDDDPTTGHTGGITQILFSPDGKTLASGSIDGSVILWDIAAGKCRQKIEAHRGTVSRIAFSPDGKTLATGGTQDRAVKLWEVETAHLSAVFGEQTEAIIALTFSVDGRYLFSNDNQILRVRYAPRLDEILSREQEENSKEALRDFSH